jgi:hypothetical protein
MLQNFRNSSDNAKQYVLEGNQKYGLEMHESIRIYEYEYIRPIDNSDS